MCACVFERHFREHSICKGRENLKPHDVYKDVEFASLESKELMVSQQEVEEEEGNMWQERSRAS